MGINTILIGDAHDFVHQTICDGLSGESVTIHACSDVFEVAAMLPSYKPAGFLIGTEETLMGQQGALINLAINEGWHCVVWCQERKLDAALAMWSRSHERISLVKGINEIRLLVREFVVQRATEQDPVRPEYFANAEEITALLGPLDDE